jgi:hypothetical protein
MAGTPLASYRPWFAPQAIVPLLLGTAVPKLTLDKVATSAFNAPSATNQAQE